MKFKDMINQFNNIDDPKQNEKTNSSQFGFKNVKEFFKYVKEVNSKKTKSEKCQEFLAAFVTIVIVTCLILIFWFVPFLHKAIFP